MSDKHTFHIKHSDGQFWLVHSDKFGKFDEIAPFATFDTIANGFKWSMQVKTQGQRKFHNRSIITSSIYAMLDNVKAELKQSPSATVKCLTPDIELNFFQD